MLKIFIFITFLLILNLSFIDANIIEEDSNEVNPLVEMASHFMEGMMDGYEDSNRKKQRRNQNKIKGPHRHKEVIETRGPGFTTVQVREFIPIDDMSNNLFRNDMNMMGGHQNNIIEQILNDLTPPPMPMQMPMIFVKSRKNLKQRDENKNVKIFSALDNLFDSFFDIGKPITGNIHNSNNGNINVLNITDMIKESENNDYDDFPFISPEIENKLIKIIPAKKREIVNKDVNKEEIKIKEVSKETENKELIKEEKLTIKENKQTNDEKEVTRLVNATPLLNIKENINTDLEITHLQKLINYSLYLFLFIIFVLFIKFILSKVSEQEKTSFNQNTKHSINEIEDELKSMKDRNKLY